MDTQTLFTVLGSVAAVIAVAIYILSLMTKNAVLESEQRIMKEIDNKFDKFESKIAKYVDERLEVFENRILERVSDTVIEVLESHSRNENNTD